MLDDPPKELLEPPPVQKVATRTKSQLDQSLIQKAKRAAEPKEFADEQDKIVESAKERSRRI